MSDIWFGRVSGYWLCTSPRLVPPPPKIIYIYIYVWENVILFNYRFVHPFLYDFTLIFIGFGVCVCDSYYLTEVVSAFFPRPEKTSVFFVIESRNYD